MTYQFVNADNESTWDLTLEEAQTLLAADPAGRVFGFDDGAVIGTEVPPDLLAPDASDFQ